MTGKWVLHRHHIANHLSKVSTTIVPVGSDEALMEEIAYVDRNSIMAGYRCMPTEYRWGMSRYFFKDTLSMDALLAGFEKIGERSLKNLKRNLSTRVDIPRDWEIDKSGMINPRCFVDYRIVESIYRSPNRYLYFLSRKLEGKIDMKLSQGVGSFIPDKEMRSITDSLTREMFGLEKRGLLNLKNAVDAFKLFDLDKNIKLFEEHGVMNEIEIKSRQDIFFENYSKIINIEALTMIEMASRDIIPAVNRYVGDVAMGANAKEKLIPGSCAVERDIVQKLSDLTYKAYHTLAKLETSEKVAASITNNVTRAEAYRDTVIPTMKRLREFVDEMELLTSSEYWPLPSYGDMMFKV